MAGLDDSSLATISAPLSAVTLFSLTRGVWPMSSRTLLAILGLEEKRLVEEDVVRETDDEDEGAKAVAPAANVARVRRAAESFILIDLILIGY